MKYLLFKKKSMFSIFMFRSLSMVSIHYDKISCGQVFACWNIFLIIL